METNSIAPGNQINTFRAGIVSGKFVRIEYLTDISEFIKTDALVKKINVDTIELGTGEEIYTDRIVRIDGVLSPNFPGYDNYSCDC
ncbi:MAG: hypothetical protein LH609_13125 [Rudanella sp.]|nr:hypothetical protein [Rudanella sp.]